MKFMLSFLLSIAFLPANAQSKTITEDTPLAVDGMEYGYSIKNSS